MKIKLKNAIEKYQCCGCVHGSDVSCYEKNDMSGCGCGKHQAGTMLLPIIGTVFLGLPNGFNRLGVFKEMQPNIYENFTGSGWEYNTLNVPIWKHLTKEEHTIVKGFMPRLNEPFLHICLENCIRKINCHEITQYDIDYMD